MHGDLLRAQNAAYAKLGVGLDQKGLAIQVRLMQIAENDYNCGGSGGSW